MGVEVKGAGDGVVIADRGCNEEAVMIVITGIPDGVPSGVHW